MPEVELLDKTEVWVVGIELDDVRLPDLASAAATALSLPRDRVIVTDVRDDRAVFDVLQPRIELEDVAGKQPELLAALAAVPGVGISSATRVHSFGVLGVIGASPDLAARTVAETRAVEAGVRTYVSRRVAVVSTGAEVIDGRVHDTNREAVAELLGGAGYEVRSGGRVEDLDTAIAGRVARLVSEGYGVVLTTGGVGAEDKDRTIEALHMLDPALHTAVLARYEIGHGRHVKESVRIGIGRMDWSLLVALPGPTDEVRAALPVLLAGLQQQTPLDELVEQIAVVLRKPLHQN